MSSSHQATRRDLGVDLLRAVSILYIVGYWHLAPYTNALPGYANWVTEGFKYLTLATFVFCSGWLLAGRAVRLNAAGLWDFYRRRLLRIYPLYALALVLFGVAGLASPRQLIDAALLVSMFHPPALPTLWFVTMIMLFYLVAPFMIRAAARPAVAVLIGAGLWFAFAAWHLWLAAIDLRVLLYWPVFVLAILCRVRPSVVGIGSDWLKAKRWRQASLGALVLLAMVLSAQGGERAILSLLPILPLALLGPLALFQVASPIARWLHQPSVAFLAYASFGLYLFHRPVFAALIAVWFPTAPQAQLAYMLLFALPVALLIGAALQRAYDAVQGAVQGVR